MNHPRWRGRPNPPSRRPALPGGISEPPPLARGRRGVHGSWEQVDRTTPAGAGPTRRGRRATGRRRNHPRWRGADCWSRAGGVPGREPPPLARGRRLLYTPSGSAAGTTPAGAGPTPGRRSGSTVSANHPRWRGVDDRLREQDRCGAEPPPLARGRLSAHERKWREGRTTPAGAGSTLPVYPGAPPRTNHPRWRGADLLGHPHRSVGAEPPPLARGRRRRQPVRHRLSGTTPAGAGPTPGSPPPATRTGNHPRWRGADRHRRA